MRRSCLVLVMPLLAELGIAYLDQPARQFRVQDKHGKSLFVANRDSSDVGYLLVAPGVEYEVIYRVQYPEALVAKAQSFLERNR